MWSIEPVQFDKDKKLNTEGEIKYESINPFVTLLKASSKQEIAMNVNTKGELKEIFNVIPLFCLV